jgi:hypothetical protein
LGVVAGVNEHPALSGRDQVLEALDELQSELAAGDTWENDTLPRFLDALAALLGSIENDYVNTGRPIPADPWELMAAAVRGARAYE